MGRVVGVQHVAAAVALGAASAWLYDTLRHRDIVATHAGFDPSEHPALIRQPCTLGLTGFAVGAVLLSRSSFGTSLPATLAPLLNQLTKAPFAASDLVLRTLTSVHASLAAAATLALSALTCLLPRTSSAKDRATPGPKQQASAASPRTSCASSSSSFSSQYSSQDQHASASQACHVACASSSRHPWKQLAAAAATPVASGSGRSSPLLPQPSRTRPSERQVSPRLPVRRPALVQDLASASSNRPQGPPSSPFLQARRAGSSLLSAVCTAYAFITGFALYAALCSCLAVIAICCLAVKRGMAAWQGARAAARQCGTAAGRYWSGQGRVVPRGSGGRARPAWPSTPSGLANGRSTTTGHSADGSSSRKRVTGRVGRGVGGGVSVVASSGGSSSGLAAGRALPSSAAQESRQASA